MDEINENTIWNCRQNNPELVVRDCIIEFGFNEAQADKLRFILMKRGVNKWLYARRKFIELKHNVKEEFKSAKRAGDKTAIPILEKINERMQNIARMPRWVEFPPIISRDWKKIERRIIIKGRHC